MGILSSHVIRDSSDLCLSIIGEVQRGQVLDEVLVNPRLLKDSPVSVRLDRVVYSIQSGLELRLYWESESDRFLMLPLEGRGTLDFERLGGLSDPRCEGWTGKVLLTSSYKGEVDVRYFTLSIEFSKQRL